MARSGKWGDLFRLALISSWTLFLIISDFENIARWSPLAVYSGLALLIIGVRRAISSDIISAFFSLVVDVGFLSYLVHYYGSHYSQVAVYYIIVLLGYHLLEPKSIRRASLLLGIMGYATVLMLEHYEIIDFFQDQHQVGELPALGQTVSAFFKISIGLVATYILLSISTRKIENYILNEKKLLDEKRLAEKQSRSLQKQIEASQRLESLGRLAGGVAHDFNNLLTGIMSHSQFLKEDFPKSTDCLRDIEAIINATQKASKLTAQLLTFGRKQIIRPHIISLNQVVSDTLEIFRRSISENIEFNTVLCPDLGNIKADSSQIEQVLLNLVVNARDAMPNGGKLTILTDNIEITPENSIRYPELSVGPHVLLHVTDTGEGILPEHIDTIFDPFFTTKRKDQGTGLGLSTVYGIIRQNSGYIGVESERGVSTKFSIVFSRVFETLSPQTAPQPIVSGSNETILVAEDEEMVRASVARILKRQHYGVLMASSGEEALEMYKSSSCPIDMLLSDVIMTGMTGEALANELKRISPALPVLFMSGYTEDAIVNKGILDEGTAFLAKPFGAEELLIAVSKTLKRRQKV